jgi:hypothetical protein
MTSLISGPDLLLGNIRDQGRGHSRSQDGMPLRPFSLPTPYPLTRVTCARYAHIRTRTRGNR